jgi:hypothetical protein
LDSETKILNTDKISNSENVKLGSLGLQGFKGDVSGSKPTIF